MSLVGPPFDWLAEPAPPASLLETLSPPHRESLQHVWSMTAHHPDLRTVLVSMPPSQIPLLCGLLEQTGRSMMELYRETIRSFAQTALAYQESTNDFAETSESRTPLSIRRIRWIDA